MVNECHDVRVGRLKTQSNVVHICQSDPEKAKLIVRWGRKATGLQTFETAGLPEQGQPGCFACDLNSGQSENTKEESMVREKEVSA